tara:strand:- start:1768 stop:2232 length:465 start_codon:yes stop_codon:yes gene_type:complete
MPTYVHVCENCGPFEVTTGTIGQYMELIEEHPKSEDGGSGQLPCEGCGDLSPRVYTSTSFIVKGGFNHQYNPSYRAGAEEEWIRNEIHNTKKVHNAEVGRKHRPYSGYTLKDPEKAGFKKVSKDVAVQRAEAAKKSLGDATQKVEQARKRKGNL